MKKRYCFYCGKIYQSPQDRRKIRKYCSCKCYYLSKVGKKRDYDLHGENNPNWKGGRIKDKDNYILLYMPFHPYCNSNGYVREHRFIKEKEMSRFILPHEVIHHKNRKPWDNRVSNLQLLSKKEHDLLHLHPNKIGDCL